MSILINRAAKKMANIDGNKNVETLKDGLNLIGQESKESGELQKLGVNNFYHSLMTK